jgi:hypothetical protein
VQPGRDRGALFGGDSEDREVTLGGLDDLLLGSIGSLPRAGLDSAQLRNASLLPSQACPRTATSMD